MGKTQYGVYNYLDEGELRIGELPTLGKADIDAIQTRVSRRILRWFVRREAIDNEHLRYHLSKPQPDGATELCLSALELIDRIAALVLPPRVHRHRYHGIIAPNSPPRASNLTAPTSSRRSAHHLAPVT